MRFNNHVNLGNPFSLEPFFSFFWLWMSPSQKGAAVPQFFLPLVVKSFVTQERNRIGVCDPLGKRVT